MMLKVYMDESGTHDPTGQKQGASVPVIGGHIHTPEFWAEFSGKWQSALTNYCNGKSGYFHFRELADKRLRSEPKSPYNGWNANKIDNFIHDMAFIVSQGAMPIGGCYNAKLSF